MRHFFAFVAFILLGTTGFGINQDPSLDSLIQLLEQQHTQRSRVDVLNQINTYTYVMHDSCSVDLLEKAITISKEVNYESGLGSALYNLGEYLSASGAYDSALAVMLTSLRIREKLNNETHIAQNYFSLGVIHENLGNYVNSLEYYLKSLEIRESIDDKYGIASCYNHIAIVYNYQGNFNKSLEFFLMSLEIRKGLNDPNEIASSLNNIGVIYRKLGDNKKAREYYLESLETKIELGDQVGISNGYNNIGTTYFFDQDYENALKYYFKSLQVRESINNVGALASSYLNIGEAYLKLNRFTESEDYLEKAKNLASETGNRDDLMITYKILAELNKAQGKLDNAYSYLEKYTTLNETLYAETQNELIAELQAKYELDKKEREIKLLQKENEIIKIQEENTAVIRNTFIISTIIISILIIAIMRSYWDEMASNKLLKKQKEEIENKNARLEDLNHEKDQLMRIIAHDLRSPMNQIEGLVKLISFEQDRLSEQQLESMNRISNSVKHSKELLSKILSTRSLDSAELKLKLEEVDLKYLVTEVVKDYEIEATKKRISVKVESDKEADLNALADKNYTEQVIDNLLSNAIKFSPLEEEVKIALKRNNGHVVMEILDNGPGISSDDKKKLFGKYQKLSAQPTAGETSTGLGLSIVKKYVDVMDGKIWCESNEGQGAKFVVELKKA